MLHNTRYILTGLISITLFMPTLVFGEKLDSISLFIHEGLTDTLDRSLPEGEQPIVLATNNRSYKVQVMWEPTEIKPNQIVTFDIKFFDYATNDPLTNVHYDFTVTKDGELIRELRNWFAINGVATHTAEFPSSGSFSVMVNVLGIGDFMEVNEYVAFDLKVVPEFPLSTVIVMASIVGIMIALTRFTSLSNKHKGVK